MRKNMPYLCIAVVSVIVFCSPYSADAARGKKDPRARLDEVYLLLTRANTEVNRDRDIQAFKGFVLGIGTMKKIRQEHPDFEPKEVDDIIRILQAQINVMEQKVQKNGLIEYRGKTLTLEQFTKLVEKEKEREERWERFQRSQDEERRRRDQQRVADDIRRINEINRFNAEQRRRAEDQRMKDQERRQAEERRAAEERRRRYDEQMRRNKP
jgi:hypothetical protein